MTWRTRMLLSERARVEGGRTCKEASPALTVSEWAGYLGIPTGTIYGWIRRGLERHGGGTVYLRATKTDGVMRFTADDLRLFLLEIQTHPSFGQLPPGIVGKLSELIHD